MEEIKKELLSLATGEYKEFSKKLIPNCENILGVRIPDIRKLAKKIVKEGSWKEYLENGEENYHEEIMLKGFVIANLKLDVEEIGKYVRWFVPKIFNWSICDSFCSELKIVKTNKEYFWNLINECFFSEEEYVSRFAIVISFWYFRDEKYLNQIFEIYEKIDKKEYYVMMAVAWAVSMFFVSFREETMEFLNKKSLDEITYRKSLQKIVESNRVEPEMKKIIKEMRNKI